jgi:monoamine oxidase
VIVLEARDRVGGRVCTTTLDDGTWLLLVMDEFESMSKQVPLDAPWKAHRAREWDRQTFAAWVESRLDDDSLALAGSETSSAFHGSINGAIESGKRGPGRGRR